LQPSGWLEGLDRRKTEHLALLRHALNPEAVVFMRALNRHPGDLGKGCHTTGMINVTMRHQNFYQFQVLAIEHFLNTGDITTGINNHGLSRHLTPENGAILIKRGYRNDSVAHDGQEIVGSAELSHVPTRLESGLARSGTGA
jgi:hypothetical protein